MKGAGEVDAHHKNYKYNCVPQLVLGVVRDADNTQNEADKQCSLHIEKLAEDSVDH